MSSLSAISTEKQYNLDISIEQRKPHPTIINDILSLYRSALVYSNGVYKIISDRADLPIRQVFHSGNMLPDKTEIKIGGNPFRPNQANVSFSNQSLDYTGDVIYVQDSASIYGRGEPLKIIDYSLTGISRYTEAYRQGAVHLKRQIEVQRQVTWATGMEGIAVEPGDRAIVGISMTNFEAGYGGRAVDGSSLDLIADREVTVASGYTYDFYVWHTAVDSVEQRVLANSPGTHITLRPTSGFGAQVMPHDRWAVGVNSQDLIQVRVLSVSQDQDGTTQIIGEEFKPVTFDIVCVDSKPAASYNPSPSQPSTASFVVSLCQLCVNVVTQVSCIGGFLPTAAKSHNNVFLSSSLNPVPQSLVGDSLSFVTGAQSGQSFAIISWGGSQGYGADFEAGSVFPSFVHSFEANVSPWFTTLPQSGDQYYVSFRTPAFGGLNVEIDQGGGFEMIGTIEATSGCVDITNTAEVLGARIIPFSDIGIENTNGGYWTNSALPTPGCANLQSVTTSLAISGQTQQPMYSITFPGSSLGPAGVTVGQISTLITEVCSPASESTDVSFSLMYQGQTLVNSLVVPLNDFTSLTVIGSLQPALVKFQIQNLGVQSAQTAALLYSGPTNSGFMEISKTGAGSVDTTLSGTLSVLATFNHYNASGTHSHNCFGLTATAAAQTLPEVDSTGYSVPTPFTPTPTVVPGLSAVSSGASSLLITHNLNNINAVVNVVTNWNTTLWQSSFTPNALYTNFGTQAQSGAVVYWVAR